jgi:hypothetical protein
MLDLVARAEAAPIAPPPVAPRMEAEVERQPAPPPAADPAASPYEDYDAFAHEPPFRPRRNPARRWTVAAIAAGIAMLAAAALVFYADLPGLAGQLFRPATGTPLKIVSKPVDQHTFNGNEIFAVSGIVLNPTDTRQPIPDIRADLRDAQKRIVFSWIIRPEATTLPPKGQVQFNSAQVNVPVNAQELVLSFSGEAPH